MKKNLGIAVMNFFGLAGLVGLFDLLAARFDFTVFTQIINRPAHIGFIAFMGLILAAGAFFRPQPRHNAKTA